MEAEKKIRSTIRGYEEASPEKDDTSGILAWHRMEHLMASRNAPTHHLINFGRLIWVAASLVVLAGLYYFKFNDEPTSYIASANGEIIDHPKPVGTNLTLPGFDLEPAKIALDQPDVKKPAFPKTVVRKPAVREPIVAKQTLPVWVESKPIEPVEIPPVSISMTPVPMEVPAMPLIGEEMTDNQSRKSEIVRHKSRLRLAWKPGNTVTADRKANLRTSPLISVALN